MGCTSGVPNQAWLWPSLLMSPENPMYIGVPVEKVVMPESCQSLRIPLSRPLSLLVRSGTCQFQETFSMWVRS